MAAKEEKKKILEQAAAKHFLREHEPEVVIKNKNKNLQKKKNLLVMETKCLYELLEDRESADFNTFSLF